MSQDMPPLPRPFVPGDEANPRDYYTADQMHAYAAPLLARIAELELALRELKDATSGLPSQPAIQRIDAAWAEALREGAPNTWSPPLPKFSLGDRVFKSNGSAWSGVVVGRYSTTLTPEGYCVESDSHPGSVQIYPAAALQLAAPTKNGAPT
jgi:dihydrofolate reductase (trimethoprim resistance protein)